MNVFPVDDAMKLREKNTQLMCPVESCAERAPLARSLSSRFLSSFRCALAALLILPVAISIYFSFTSSSPFLVFRFALSLLFFD